MQVGAQSMIQRLHDGQGCTVQGERETEQPSDV